MCENSNFVDKSFNFCPVLYSFIACLSFLHLGSVNLRMYSVCQRHFSLSLPLFFSLSLSVCLSLWLSLSLSLSLTMVYLTGYVLVCIKASLYQIRWLLVDVWFYVKKTNNLTYTGYLKLWPNIESGILCHFACLEWRNEGKFYLDSWRNIFDLINIFWIWTIWGWDGRSFLHGITFGVPLSDFFFNCFSHYKQSSEEFNDRVAFFTNFSVLFCFCMYYLKAVSV